MEFWRIWNILWRRKWIALIAFLVFFVAVLLATHIIPPTYEAKAKIVLRLPDPYRSITSALNVSIRASTDELANLDTMSNLALTAPVLDRVIEALELKNRKGDELDAARMVKGSMSRKIFPEPYVEIEEIEESSMLLIKATSGDAQQAADICNTLADKFQEFRREQFQQDYQALGVALRNRLDVAQQRYQAALREFTDYRKEIGSIDLEAESQALLSKISALKDSLEENRRQLAALGKSDRQTRMEIGSLDEFRKSTTETGINELTNQLKSSLNEMLRQKAAFTISVTKEHPDFRELEAELDAVQDLIKQQAEKSLDLERYSIDPLYDTLREQLVMNAIDREGLLVRQEINQQYLEGYTSDLANFPEWSMQLNQKDAKVTATRDVYREILSQLEEFDLTEGIIPPDSYLVDPATPPRSPDFPDAEVNYVLGVFLGVFWALAVAFFVEYIDIPRERRLAAVVSPPLGDDGCSK